MGCNAWNHPANCNCGWGGDTGISSSSSSNIVSGGHIKSFLSVESYVNPNAACPVCKEKVYYYQSPFGGRVFFDDLGWPWPKHRCTDNERAQIGNVKALAPTRSVLFRSKEGRALDISRLVSLEETDGIVVLKFSRLNPLLVFSVPITVELLGDQDVTTEDLNAAPSFVMQKSDTHVTIQFISARKQAIVTLRVPRRKSPS